MLLSVMCAILFPAGNAPVLSDDAGGRSWVWSIGRYESYPRRRAVYAGEASTISYHVTALVMVSVARNTAWDFFVRSPVCFILKDSEVFNTK